MLTVWFKSSAGPFQQICDSLHAEDIVRLVKGFPRQWDSARAKVGAHADDLRALAGEYRSGRMAQSIMCSLSL